MDRSFFEAPVAVPKLSGFDKSFQHLYTAKCGTLVPAFFDEVMAGSVSDVEMAASVSLPPLASDTFMRCSLKVEAFFVPMRLCFGGFQHYFVGDEFDVLESNGEYDTEQVKRLPSFSFCNDTYKISAFDLSAIFGPGTLADYLGMKSDFSSFTADGTASGDSDNIARSTFSLMPFVCYHLLYSHWYRNTLVQKDCFAPLASDNFWDSVKNVSALPFVVSNNVNFKSIAQIFSSSGDAASVADFLSGDYFGDYNLADGVNIFSLRQRNFGFDFFTCATPSPTPGDSVRVKLDPTSLATLGNGFTINQLRSLNSLAQFLERNQLSGDRYVDRLYAQYGCRPSDGVAQRPLCIGSADIEVYSKGIYSNNNDGGSASQNPFGGTLGARGGSAYGSSNGSIHICKNFKAAEPGYIMILTSLVPRVTYATGVDSVFNRYVFENSIGEMPNPILQNIGPEPIYVRELTEDIFSDDIFGYTDRYGHIKNKFDVLSGLVRDGESLESFALQRYLTASADPRIDNEFLQIPTDYMDNVTAVKSTVSEYGCWVDSYFRYRSSMPLSKYSLPSLQDPAYEHGRTITVRRGGFRF